MRGGRLVSIVLLLQSEGKMTSKQLAERLEVTERTILRDMEELSAAGVPVYAERGPQGGWRLTEGYRASLTGLHADELAALLLSSQGDTLSELGQQGALEAALRKLMAGTTEAARESAKAARSKLHIDGAGWHAHAGRGGLERHPLLPVVQEAVWEERALRIAYERDGERKERIIEPLGLVVKRNVWYVVAMTEEQELRTFRISRLSSAESLPRRFSPPADFELAAYWERSLADFKERLPRYPAKLRIKSAVLQRLNAERFVSAVETVREEGEWAEVNAMFETLESACEIILSYGAGIEALEPRELRRMVIDEIEAARMVYL
ncbi:YafY family transcriptional regulator [Paenibacillus nanensis]|uniref:YafY family transcriptional regulator n=1 Tax=Paenibacillus nanensis TaxID=393251 RepID=A0A3A1UPZ4_9BACL|nr:YafY family protein [Paenibacillus nanensis]RIX49397.1 YafY family transcriptional regulator [Paenibacillus nanensis]